MGYSLQTLSGFETFLHNQGFDNPTTNQIANYLATLGYTSRLAQDIEPGSTPTFNPDAQADIAVSTNAIFTPTGFATILVDIDDANIVVTGTSSSPVNVAVATDSGVSNTVTLNDYGDDQVFLGSGGNNSVTTGHGSDTVVGGVTGNDYVTVSSYSGSDSINLSTGSGNDSVLDSGSGKDTIDLGSGFSTVQASSSTGNLDINTGTGSTSISLGSSGQDTINVATNAGAGIPGVTDTITALGSDTVTFDSSIALAHEYNISATTTVITFGGQLTLDDNNNYVPDPSNPPVQTVSITTNGGNVLVEFTDGHFKA